MEGQPRWALEAPEAGFPVDVAQREALYHRQPECLPPSHALAAAGVRLSSRRGHRPFLAVSAVKGSFRHRTSDLKAC